MPHLRTTAIWIVCVLSIALRAAAGPLDDPQLDRRANELIAQMTLDEKLGQLNQYSYGRDATGPSGGNRDYDQLIAGGKVGSFLNVTGAKRVNEIQRKAVEGSRLKIPILFGLDVIHGYRTTFPAPLGLASTWDPDLVQRTAAVAAREAAADGVRWTFSPMVDIARDARWGRIVEGAGEDPYLGSLFARAYVRGYQGEHLSDPTSIAACAKHYVGYGAAEAGRDYNTTEISDRTMREIYLPPFQAAADAGAVTFMSAFHAINGVPASANPQTLDQILRREWRFKGFVVSDWTAVKELIEHGIANDGPTAARKGIIAGVDMDMEAGLYLNDLANEVKAGRVPQKVIDEAVRRVLRVKLALGLFERPYTQESAAAAAAAAAAEPSQEPADVELARTAAEQSFVLLKNDDRTLPFGSDDKTIALIGPFADAPGEMLGCWRGRGDSKQVVTLRSALTDYAANHQMRVVYEKGTDIVGGKEDGIAPAVKAARTADIVLLCVGEEAGDMTGEAASRTNINLPGLQEKLIDAVAAAGKRVVLIVFSGRPLALSPYVDKAEAIVQAWQPGLQAGPALVRVLDGETDFTGRLTVSMPRVVGQLPLYYNHLNTGRPPGDADLTRPATTGEEKFLSRYIDQQNAPLYPFGYGLTYAQFEYTKPTLSATSLGAASLNEGKQALTVKSSIRNSSSRDGVEVAQCYIRLRGTSVSRPVRELKGYQRIALRAGESKQVTFTLGKEELSFWNIDMKRVVEPSMLTVWISKDSASGEGVDVVISD